MWPKVNEGVFMRRSIFYFAAFASLALGVTSLALAGSHSQTPSSAAPPRADAGPDRTALTGEPIVFSALKSSDPDGTIITYDWDFGDGTRAIGLAPRHVFWRAGTYRVKLSVRDDSRVKTNAHTDVAVVTIKRPVNTLPVAKLAVRNSIALRVGEPVRFDASKSRDTDGNILSYKWTFGTGATALGVAPVFTYQRPGSYKVVLTVSDDYGETPGEHSAQITVTIGPRVAKQGVK